MRANELRRAHGCAMYRTPEEAREIVAEFLAEGAARREAAVLLDGAADGAGVVTRLDEDGRPAREWLDDGTLVLVDAGATRRLVLAPPQRVRATVAGVLDRARTGGLAGVRIAGTVPGPLRIAAGRALGVFDRAVDGSVRGEPATVLCLYEESADGGPAALARRHAVVVEAPAAYDDGALRVTRHGPDVRLAGETDLSHRDALRAAVRGARGIDTASLRFLDVGALEVLARAVAAGARLTRRSPAVERLQARCAPFAAADPR